MVRKGRVVRYQRDYILGSYRWIFQNVDLQDPRHNTDHLIVIGCLYRTSPREHSRYLRRRTRFPLHSPGCQTRTVADKIFDDLRRAIPKTDK